MSSHVYDDDDPHEDDLPDEEYSALLNYSVAFQQRSDERGVRHLEEEEEEEEEEEGTERDADGQERARHAAAHRRNGRADRSASTSPGTTSPGEHSPLLSHYDYSARTPVTSVGGVQASGAHSPYQNLPACEANRHIRAQQREHMEEEEKRRRRANRSGGRRSDSTSSANTSAAEFADSSQLRHRSFAVGAELLLDSEDGDHW
jgi:hypothetical protein